MPKLIKRSSKSITPTFSPSSFFILRSSFFILFILSFSSCKSVIPKNYKIHIAPIINKTNWAQLDTELLEYLHSFFNKIALIENKKELSDIQIHVSINNIQIFTHTSGNLDVPVLSELSLYATVTFIGKKINYNLELYEESQYIPGQNETIDYALQRLYEKIATRIYFEIVKTIKNDKEI